MPFRILCPSPQILTPDKQWDTQNHWSDDESEFDSCRTDHSMFLDKGSDPVRHDETLYVRNDVQRIGEESHRIELTQVFLSTVATTMISPLIGV